MWIILRNDGGSIYTFFDDLWIGTLSGNLGHTILVVNIVVTAKEKVVNGASNFGFQIAQQRRTALFVVDGLFFGDIQILQYHVVQILFGESGFVQPLPQQLGGLFTFGRTTVTGRGQGTPGDQGHHFVNHGLIHDD